MRLPRPVTAAAASSIALAAALGGSGVLGGSAAVGGSGVLAGAAGAGVLPPAAGRPAAGSGPAVLISPDAVHVGVGLRAAPSTAFCERHYRIACYQPAQLQQAYHLRALYRSGITGAGQTIVIVDSYGSPTVRHDLAVFDRAEGLPAPPSLKIIQPAGKVAPYKPNGNREGWAGETTLDVEYAHAIAPRAAILVVETPTAENEGRSGFPRIVQAEKYVIDHHLGGVISQSFSATEQTFATPQRLLTLRGAIVDAARKGVTILAASGDSGAADLQYNGASYYLRPVTSWPDSDPLVTGVGGVKLHLAAAGNRAAAPTVWNDTYNTATNEFIDGGKGPNPLAGGGGKSAVFARPGYQNAVRAVVGASRGVPDIAMSAACNGAVDVYQSFAGQKAGWYPTCGTSEATPEFAGIVALADQAAGHPLGLINPALYQLSLARAPGLVDVVSGNSTVSFTQGGKEHRVTGFRARRGYDLATGTGTVNAARFVPELALLAGHPRWSTAKLTAALRRLDG